MLKLATIFLFAFWNMFCLLNLSGCNVQVSFCILEWWWESFHLWSWQRRATGTWQWKDSSGNFELACTHDMSQLCNFYMYNCYLCWYLQMNIFIIIIIIILINAPYFLPTWNICQWVYIDTRCQRILISLQDNVFLKIIMITFFFQSSTKCCNVLYLNFLGRKGENIMIWSTLTKIE